MLSSELRVSRQHDSAVNKLSDWLARFETKLEVIYKEAKDFHSKERMSEARSHLDKLDEMKSEVDSLIAEVWFLVLFYKLSRTTIGETLLYNRLSLRYQLCFTHLQPLPNYHVKPMYTVNSSYKMVTYPYP